MSWIFETFLCVIILSRLMSLLNKDKTRRDSLLILMICPYGAIPLAIIYPR